MEDIAIKVKNITKYYKLYDTPRDRLKEALNPFKKKYHKQFCVFENINFTIRRGEVVGIIGRNGCGKSTLLKLITGELQPSKGEVTVNGKITALLELGAGLNPEFTGLENIFFYGNVLGISNDQIKQRIENIKAFADIGEFINQPVKNYSSGMKSRLGFAVAIHVEPDILILDEILAVGDAQFKRKCFSKIEELFSNGCTVILVSHDDQSIAKMCTRVIFIDDKNISKDGKPKDVLQLYQDSIVKNSREISIQNINTLQEKEPIYTAKIEADRGAIESSIFIRKVKIIDQEQKDCETVKCRQNIWVAIELDYDLQTKERIRIAFNIRDTQGIVRGGGVIEDIDLQGAGSICLEKQIFQSFSPSDYFVTGTCNQWSNHEWVVVDRKHDAYMFKIKEWPDEGYWGADYLGPI